MPVNKKIDNPPKAEDIRKDVSMAYTHSSDISSHVEKLKEYIRNDALEIRKAQGKIPAHRQTISPKVVEDFVEERSASIFNNFTLNKRVFFVDANSANNINSAYKTEALINYQFDKDIKKSNFLNTLIEKVIKESFAVVKIGWEYKKERKVVKVPKFVDTIVPKDDNELRRDLDMSHRAALKAGMDPNRAIDQAVSATNPSKPSQEHIGDEIQEMETTILDKPTFEVIDYENLRIDPYARDDIDKARFVAVIKRTTWKDLRDDDNVDKSKIEPYKNKGFVLMDEETGVNYEHDEEMTVAANNPLMDVIEYWGYHNIYKNDKRDYPFMALILDNQIVKIVESPFAYSKRKILPFVNFQYFINKKDIYGRSDLDRVNDSQRIQGGILRGILDNLRSVANGQTGIPRGFLDEDEAIKYAQGLDYIYNPPMDPRAVFTHQFPEISQSTIGLMSYFDNKYKDLSNNDPGGSFTSNQNKFFGKGDRPTNANKKIEKKILSSICDGLTDIGNKLIILNKLFLTETKSIKVSQDKFVDIHNDDISYNFNITAKVKTDEEIMQATNLLFFTIQGLGNTSPELYQKLSAEAAKLGDMDTLSEEIKAIDLSPKPSEFEIEMQKLEIQHKKAQVMNEIHKGEENKSDTMLKQAKAKLMTTQDAQAGLDHLKQLLGIEDDKRKKEQEESSQDFAIGNAALVAEDNAKKYLDDQKRQEKENKKQTQNKGK